MLQLNNDKINRLLTEMFLYVKRGCFQCQMHISTVDFSDEYSGDKNTFTLLFCLISA